MGLGIEDVSFELGDSSMPTSPLQGGSWTVATVGSAVKLACDQLCDSLVKLAHKHATGALADAKRDGVLFRDGAIVLAADPSQRLAITELMALAKQDTLEETVKSIPYVLQRMKHTVATHSAVFVEVRVDQALGIVKVTRVVSAIAAGRIINPKTARSQIMGAIVGGIGQALHEETLTDHTLGRYVNHDFADYHIPVNADVGEIDVIFVDEHDDVANALGAKGVGEIGIVGVAAAIGNAIFHATGKRIRRFRSRSIRCSSCGLLGPWPSGSRKGESSKLQRSSASRSTAVARSHSILDGRPSCGGRVGA